jgi:nicotinamidase-related amidase
MELGYHVTLVKDATAAFTNGVSDPKARQMTECDWE